MEKVECFWEPQAGQSADFAAGCIAGVERG